eukprot:TRINITY_DN43596_c0_g1_i1.p1 TRINITY_DN43596_c0_g1~~TRINITY_DN43596_c0_g1_i1.p1  ORF type:complete len:1195 (-),score=263.57 TRINITY_DN43596_c0_g1_i1:29-3577(-)
MEFSWSDAMDEKLGRTPKARRGAGPKTLPRIGDERCGTPSAPGSASGRRPMALSASEPALRMSNIKKEALRRVSDFVERNTKVTPQTEARKDFSRVQREMNAADHHQHEQCFFGNKGVIGFRNYLKSKHGTLVYGWRALDQDKSGRLSFYEFCNACRRMGYHGELRTLWKQLDNNRNGYVSLMELDPEVGMYMGTFKLALLKKYGDMLSAWQKGMDVNKNGRIELKEIESCVADLGLDLDPGKLFAMIRGPSGPLTLADFDPDAYNRWQSGDTGGILSKTSMEFIDDLPGLSQATNLPEELTRQIEKSAPKKWRAKLIAADQAEVKVEQEKTTRLRLGLHTAAGFKQALIVRCGSLFGAWREKLDLDGNERLSFGEFCQALHRLGFHGDVSGLWDQLDVKKRGFIVFADLDPETDTMLKELKGKLREKYGNVLMAWVKIMDSKGTGIVNIEQFAKACEDVGFSGDPEKCFRLVQPELTRKSLTLQDFDTKAFLAMGRGDFRMISEQDSSASSSSPSNKKKIDLSFEERNSSGFMQQVQNAWETARREEFAKACRVQREPPHSIHTAEQFEQLCKRTFGTIISAWRHCLDYDQNGKLTFNEFCQSLRRLGYDGDYRAIWKQFAGEKGHVSLKDLSPEEDEIVDSFLKKLGEAYGTLDEAWKFGFNKDPYSSVDEQELVAACQALGWLGNPKKLWKCLQPAPSKQLITIWDLDPCCNRKKQRGETVFITEPKEVETKIELRASFGREGREAEKRENEKHSSSVMSSGTSVGGGGLTELQQLRNVLCKRYGSTIGAWRHALDPKLTGNTSWARFMMCADDCAFSGNLKGLWHEISRGETTATLKDVDGKSLECLTNFREELLSKFGSISEAWHDGIDKGKLSRLAEPDFSVNCEQAGLTCKNWSRLFQLFLSRLGQRSIGLEDLRVLLIGVPFQDQPKVWDNAAEALPGNASDGKSASPSGSVAGFDATASPKLIIARASQEHAESLSSCNSLDRFKRILKEKFGSLFAAWRDLLDADNNGVMTQVDFAQACRHLGVMVTRVLWTALAGQKDQVGFIDLDPQAAAGFDELEKLLLEQHGSCKVGWRKIFDSGNTLQVDLSKFKSGCEKLGLTCDAAQLFKLLRPEPGRASLAYEDLWVNLDRNTLALAEQPGALSPRSFAGSRPLSGVSRGSARSRPASAAKNAG